MLEYLDPQFLIKALGLVGVIAIVFSESGLFFGFFLPGDSLLFTAGFLASQGFLPIVPLVIGTTLAAILGDAFGYWFGRVVGPKIFTREDSFFFHKKHIERARLFFEKHGKKAIIIARFVPVVRTFAPIVAGVGGMKYPTFFTYNVIGGVMWATGITMAGYILGQAVPSIDQYILPIILAIILASFIPWGVEWYRERKMSGGHFS